MILICDCEKEITDVDYQYFTTILRKCSVSTMVKMNDIENKKHILAIFVLLIGLYINDSKTYYDTILSYKTMMLGKPSVNGLYLSISHTESAIAIAIDNYKIGIDIENEIDCYVEIADLVLSENEKRLSCIEERLFRKIWTLKESVLKAYGMGLQLDLRMIDFSKELNMCLFEKKGWIFEYISFQDYSIAICSKRRQFIKRLCIDELRRYIILLEGDLHER